MNRLLATLRLAGSLLLVAACSTTPSPPATPAHLPSADSGRVATAQPSTAEPTVTAAPSTGGSPEDPAVSAPVETEPETRPAGAAVGDVLVAPTRIVFEGNDRTAEVTLVNVGTVRGTYRISLIDYQMDPSGKLQEVDPEANASSASRLLRFSPRQVTLEPNYMQTVRILLRKPADLPPGEYRSHMLFRSIPEPRPAPDPGAERPQEGISIELTPIFGISIPVIIRHGELGSDAEIEDMSVQQGTANAPGAVTVTLARSGDRSVFGRLRVSFRPDGGAASTVVGLINGIAIYPPLARRQVTIPLEGGAGPLPPGTLVVTYSDLEDETERVLAEATARVP